MFHRILRVALAATVIAGLTAVGGMSAAAGTPRWRVTGILSGNVLTTFDALTADRRDDAWLPWATCHFGTCTLVVTRWNGTSWRPVAVPKAFVNSSAFQDATAVAASSPSRAWVFAELSSGLGMTRTAVLRWTGTGWAAHPAMLNAAIAAAAAPSGTDVWAFGAGKGPYVAHYNGSKWSQVPVPIFAGQASATSPGNVWVIGEPVVQTAKTTVFVDIMRFNGHKWITTPLPSFNLKPHQIAQEQGIVAVSPASVWATGTLIVPPASTVGTQDQTPFLLHWDGQKWFRIKVPYADPFAPSNGAIAPDGHGGVWLGVADQGAPAGTLLHYNHGHWSRVPAPATKGDVDLPGVLAAIPGTQSVWGIGAEQMVTASGNFDTVVLKYGP
jgi:hypothetical protein